MDEPTGRLRASELENSGDVGNNPTDNRTMGEVIATRFSRRDLLRGSSAHPSGLLHRSQCEPYGLLPPLQSCRPRLIC